MKIERENSLIKIPFLKNSQLSIFNSQLLPFIFFKPSLSTEIKCQSTVISMMRKKNT